VKVFYIIGAETMGEAFWNELPTLMEAGVRIILMQFTQLFSRHIKIRQTTIY